MTRSPTSRKQVRCAIYTRKSTEEGLEQAFNSLDAQRESCAAYIASQKHEGWTALPDRYDDGGFSGGSIERPALQALLGDVQAGKIDVVVVYKVDRLTRALADFARIVTIFDAAGVSFVSVTQAFNTTTSMGRLTLNVLLSFAQFEREVTAERIRDKIAASKAKGMWMGGTVPIGYRVEHRKLVPVPDEAALVRRIFERYLALGSVSRLKTELDQAAIRTPLRQHGDGGQSGGAAFSRGKLYVLLANPVFIGRIRHKDAVHPGQHAAILDESLWQAVQDKLADNRRSRTLQIRGAVAQRAGGQALRSGWREDAAVACAARTAAAIATTSAAISWSAASTTAPMAGASRRARSRAPWPMPSPHGCGIPTSAARSCATTRAALTLRTRSSSGSPR